MSDPLVTVCSISLDHVLMIERDGYRCIDCGEEYPREDDLSHGASQLRDLPRHTPVYVTATRTVEARD